MIKPDTKSNTRFRVRIHGPLEHITRDWLFCRHGWEFLPTDVGLMEKRMHPTTASLNFNKAAWRCAGDPSYADLRAARDSTRHEKQRFKVCILRSWQLCRQQSTSHSFPWWIAIQGQACEDPPKSFASSGRSPYLLGFAPRYWPYILAGLTALRWISLWKVPNHLTCIALYFCMACLKCN